MQYALVLLILIPCTLLADCETQLEQSEKRKKYITQAFESLIEFAYDINARYYYSLAEIDKQRRIIRKLRRRLKR